ncbi:MAG: DnaJ domain-containing protein [Epsilonproteobacteria bacterium]|nr:DnaJ domain-containing protein [Campylobacterota bacterium]
MNKKFKNISWSILGFLFLIGIFLIAIMLLKGGLWLSTKIYPWLVIITNLALVVSIFILLPLSVLKKTRRIAGSGMILSSYAFGATLWVWSLLLTYTLWGGVALIIGLFIMGVGVVPIAMLATTLNTLWSQFGQLVLLLVMTIGARIFGTYLVISYEKQREFDDMYIVSETFDASISDITKSYEDEIAIKIGSTDFSSDPLEPAEQEITLEESIDAIKKEISEKRINISDLLEEIATLKRELVSFETEYYGRVGILYVKLDELDLSIKEYFKRIELLKEKRAKNLVEIEKLIEEYFRDDHEKIKEEAEQYTEEYEAVKEKVILDEASENRLKTLYRELARKYHPDMAQTPEEKERFHEFMAAINQAYNDKDLEKMEELVTILKTPEKVFIKETLEEEFENLLSESEKLDEIISKLEEELEAVKSSDTYQLKIRVDEAKNEGRDLIQEMEDRLKANVSQKEEELAKVKQEFKNIAKDLT